MPGDAVLLLWGPLLLTLAWDWVMSALVGLTQVALLVPDLTWFAC